jgi:benzoate membrane transport protein
MQVFKDLSPQLISNAFVAFLFAASGPVAIILSVGAGGRLTSEELSSWIFGVFIVNGLMTIYFCLKYRQPLAFFWTIPGTVLIGPALDHLSFPQVVGAFLATGVFMAVLGMSGVVGRLMKAAPMPIVMGMVAGVFMKFGLDWIGALRDDAAIAIPMTAAFIALSAIPRLAKVMPPLIGALVVGVAAWGIAHGFDVELGDSVAQVGLPTLQIPVFSLQAMIELVVPLAITVLVVQNGQGVAVLKAAGHEPPVNTIATACGIGSIIAGTVGSASSCLTGPVNAIISADGAKEKHYAAGVVVGLLALPFGLAAPIFTKFMLAAPAAFIASLAGLAMLRVLQMAFMTAFQGRFIFGALITFLVTVSDLTLFNIGAAFWGLVFGVIASWLLERDDFKTLAEA